MKARLMIPILASVAMILSSCRHKDIDFKVDDRSEVYIAFDWSRAPDADPTSMMVYFYPTTDEDPLLYTFGNKNGGKIAIPYGYYTGLCLNGDNTDWSWIRHTEDPELFEVYTRDAESLEGNDIVSRSVPRAEGTENERMAKTPRMIWSDRRDNINLDNYSFAEENIKTITFYPDEAVCHYTVDIVDIEHSEYLHNAVVDATISGMAEGYLQGKRKATDVAVTMPFTLKPENQGKSLHSEFLTFGECNSASHRHLLTVYVYLTDGTKWYHTFDVTNQVTTAQDTRHVHIIIHGLDLPKPIGSGSGFNPDVNGWNEININLNM